MREFLYVDDLADGVVFLAEHYSGEDHVNIGTGAETSIAELAEIVADVVGFQGRITFDPSKPDGMARRVMDNSRVAAMGWRPETDLCDGIERTYRWFLDRLDMDAEVRGYPAAERVPVVDIPIFKTLTPDSINPLITRSENLGL